MSTLLRDYAAARLSFNIVELSRMSVEEYYTHHKGNNPPAYESVRSPPPSLRKYNIQPRDDEGREVLPPYSCAISLENVFMKKNELEGAVHRSQDRNWHRVFVKLQGTALTFHQYKGSRVTERFALSGGFSNPDMPDRSKKGDFLRGFNLQHADVGIAADYTKKRYVIRVRAEADQFLLSCTKLETFVQWLQSLFAAIDLALPLDDREIPRDLSIPRSTASRCVRFTGDIDSPSLVRQQVQLMRDTYPHLVDDEIPEVSPSSSTSSILSSSSESRANSLTSTPRPLVTSISSSPARRPYTTRTITSSRPGPRPSIDEVSGKWQPDTIWTSTHDMMYAKRCMAILMHRSPRKTNYVIMKGKQWIVDWATGKLTRWAPPEYSEELEARGGDLSIGQYGTLVQA